jgi:hypothetical protein
VNHLRGFVQIASKSLIRLFFFARIGSFGKICLFPQETGLATPLGAGLVFGRDGTPPIPG